MDDDGVLQLLMDMGFPKERCLKALSETSNAGIEAAANWLLTHPESDEATSQGYVLGSKDSADSNSTPSVTTDTTAGSNTDSNHGDVATQVPLSIKCDDCGKQFKSELDAQAHAVRTSHKNFSESTDEIKPLTEEERQQAIARLEEKRLQKRAEREEKEKLEAKDREKVRRKTGQEISKIKHEIEVKEAMKIAQQKKREKMEERLAKEKVRQEIARDRAERAAKNKTNKEAVTTSSQPSTSETVVPTVKKDYDTCKLQIRLFGGQTLVNTFKASDTLVDVNRYILMNRSDDGAPYSLMTNFPKHTFVGDDFKKTLKELGLVPSSVLILTKQNL